MMQYLPQILGVLVFLLIFGGPIVMVEMKKKDEKLP